MVITCPNCGTQYRFDPARFEGAPTKKMRCHKCNHAFVVENPEISTEETSENTMAVSADIVHGSPMEPPSSDVQLPELAPLAIDLRVSMAVIAGQQAGSVFQISKPRVYLGRGSAMDIQLKDPEVSRRHAMMEIRGDAVTLCDLGATNGCFVRGERVGRAELGHQDEFTIGSTTIMLIVTHERDEAV
jgi:predicted Zn finger-like uncharacterized protein